MGSNGTKLAESERGVWFSWKRNGICTPHFIRKNKLILFPGAENRFCPRILEPRFRDHTVKIKSFVSGFNTKSTADGAAHESSDSEDNSDAEGADAMETMVRRARMKSKAARSPLTDTGDASAGVGEIAARPAQEPRPVL